MTAPDPVVPTEPGPDDDVIVRDGHGRLLVRVGPHHWRIRGVLTSRSRRWSELGTDTFPPQVYVRAERLATAEAERDAQIARTMQWMNSWTAMQNAYRDAELECDRIGAKLAKARAAIDRVRAVVDVNTMPFGHSAESIADLVLAALDSVEEAP